MSSGSSSIVRRPFRREFQRSAHADGGADDLVLALDGQALVVRGCACCFYYCQIIVGFVHSSKTIIFNAYIEEPAMAVV